ncbi:MAG: patatin-like phospholipase family protein [Thermodesulforhabdaceae bacterium]
MMRWMRILAGDAIFPVARDGALRLKNVKVIAGAAGGPKWLVLYHFDRHLASLIKSEALGSESLTLIGSSIGAWRMAALGCADPVKVMDEFFEAYMAQRYSLKPSVKEITSEARRILDILMPPGRTVEPLDHPRCRLAIITVRHRMIGNSDNTLPLTCSVALIGLVNLISRRAMKYLVKRVVFADKRNGLPLDFDRDTFSTEIVPLSERNLRDALLASGAIPLVMESIRNIEGAPPGTYRDGGIIDYHLDIPYRLDDGFFVLQPHYTDKIIPGWFDKYRPRSPSSTNLRNVLLVCPTKALVESLPGGKIPDRNDFYAFKGRDAERLSYWRKAVEAGKRMADEFFEALESGRIRECVEPIR